MRAARNGRLRCVAALLEHNAAEQVKAVDKSSRNALMWAAADGYSRCVAALLAHNAAEQQTIESMDQVRPQQL